MNRGVFGRFPHLKKKKGYHNVKFIRWFFYEHNDRKSVIKIIPIEGEELVNGERQKKFSEILSEIVIAKWVGRLSVHEYWF
jgi:hypothetical protein